jgi:dolichol-phosphate mannosyltransferase
MIAGRPEALAATDVAVGVVVPAYAVADHIVDVVAGIPPWVRTIVVVDDGSQDDLATRVERCGDPRVVLLRHALNRGVGAAMRTGFEHALALGLDIVVKMDGDGQMDPAILPDLVRPLLEGSADMTKGNRYRDFQALRSMPKIRLAGNAGLTFFVKIASGYWNLFDPANGYIALRSLVLERIEMDRLPARYYFECGLLVQLGTLGAVVKDVPMPARYRGEASSLSVSRTFFEFPPRLFVGLLRRLFWRYVVYDFTAASVFLLVGIPSFVFGAIYGSVRYAQLQLTGTFASAGTVMIAAMPIILGVVLVTQAIVLDIQAVPKVPISPPLSRGHRRLVAADPPELLGGPRDADRGHGSGD